MTDSSPAEPGEAPADAGARGVLAFRLLQLACFAPLIAAVIAYFVAPDFQATMDVGIHAVSTADLAALRQWGQSLGPWAWLFTSLLMVVQAIAAPIPAVLVTATNAWLFGWVAGGILSIVSATVAATICYVLARSFGEPLVLRLVSREHLAKTDAFIERHGATAVLVARLVPFVPFDPISYVAGLTRMRVWTFFWATLLGQIPAGMTYSYLATQADKPNVLLIVAPSAFLGLVVLGVAARRALLGADPHGAAEDSPPAAGPDEG